MVLKRYLIIAIITASLIGISQAHANGCEGVTTAAGTTVPDPTFATGGGHNFSAGQHLDYLDSGWINPDHSVAALTTLNNGYNYPVNDVKLTNCHIDLGGGVPSLQPNQVSIPVAPAPSTPTPAQIQAANDAASNSGSCVGMTTSSGLTLEGVGFTAGYIITEMSISSTQDGNVTSYGEHGGYVYPAEDVKLLNCHIEADSDGYPTLAFDNTEAGQSAQIQSNTEQELENAGIDDADAGNFAGYAYQHPQSTCANDVSAILDAVQILNKASNTPSHQRDDQWESVNNTAQQQFSNAENQAADDCK